MKNLLFIALVAVTTVAVSCSKEQNAASSSYKKESQLAKVDFSKSLKANQSYGIGGQDGIKIPPPPKP